MAKKRAKPDLFNPLEYLVEFGRQHADKTARAAGLSPAYFNQICYGHRRASVDAAEKLVKASGGRLGFVLILQHRVKRDKGTGRVVG